MKSQAIEQGERLIALEADLEKQFQDRTISDDILRQSLEVIARARMELRYIHLATHLKTPGILSPEQISKYNTLRGYSDPDPDPCAQTPKGHDATTWRKHNGCQ